MALTKGSRRLFDWLKEQRAGTVVTRQEVMSVTGWSAVSFKGHIYTRTRSHHSCSD